MLLLVQQPGIADDLGSFADADDDRTPGRLAVDSPQRCWIIIAAHGGDDDIVGAFRMAHQKSATGACGYFSPKLCDLGKWAPPAPS